MTKTVAKYLTDNGGSRFIRSCLAINPAEVLGHRLGWQSDTSQTLCLVEMVQYR